jgi:hypothetical protein
MTRVSLSALCRALVRRVQSARRAVQIDPVLLTSTADAYRARFGRDGELRASDRERAETPEQAAARLATGLLTLEEVLGPRTPTPPLMGGTPGGGRSAAEAGAAGARAQRPPRRPVRRASRDEMEAALVAPFEAERATWRPSSA